MDDNSDVTFLYAIKSGNTELINYFIQNQQLSRKSKYYGLSLASEMGNFDLVKKLVDIGGIFCLYDKNLLSESQQEQFMDTAYKYHKYIQEHKEDYYRETGIRNTNITRFLLDSKITVYSSYLAIIKAIEFNNIEIAKFLIQKSNTLINKYIKDMLIDKNRIDIYEEIYGKINTSQDALDLYYKFKRKGFISSSKILYSLYESLKKIEKIQIYKERHKCRIENLKVYKEEIESCNYRSWYAIAYFRRKNIDPDPNYKDLINNQICKELSINVVKYGILADVMDLELEKFDKKYHKTLIHASIKLDYSDIFEYLMEKTKTKYSDKQLRIAVSYNQIHIIEFIIHRFCPEFIIQKKLHKILSDDILIFYQNTRRNIIRIQTRYKKYYWKPGGIACKKIWEEINELNL